MAQQKQRSQSKQRSSGGGRKRNSEPQVQVFKQFAGMNIQENQADFDPSGVDHDQSDLQMTYFEIQNNCRTTALKTVETVNATDFRWLTPPSGKRFSGPIVERENYIYAAMADGSIWYTDEKVHQWKQVSYTNDTPSLGSIPAEHDWTWLGFVGGYFVALTEQNDIFISKYEEGSAVTSVEYHPEVPSPETNELTIYGEPWVYGRQYALYPRGTLKIQEVNGYEETPPDDLPYRIGITYTRCNIFGPTEAAPVKYFWVNHPTTEWSTLCYLAIDHYAKKEEGFDALEFYYVEGEAQDPAFFYRLEFDLDGDDPRSSFHWTGYNVNTDMWTVANLSVPTKNYTGGVKAQYATSIDGRVYFWGEQGSLDRLYIGGNAGNELSVSTGTGGGFADCDPGQGNRIRVVAKYKTQSGNNIVTLLCDNANSQHEYRYNLVENNVSLSTEQSVKGWQTEHVSGAVGCKSPYGATVAADGLYAVSRYGLALTTLTMEYNSQIRAQYVSDAIEPVFLDQLGVGFSDAVLYEINDTLYLVFGASADSSDWLEGIVFCYDINGKAWWTMTLDTTEPIVNIIPLDYERSREGLLVLTETHADFVPLTMMDKPDEKSHQVDFYLQTGCIGTTQPLNGLQNLVQFEFRFDYFCGDMTVTLEGIDQLGRKVTTTKRIHHDDVVWNWAEYMRIDLKLESYTLSFKGHARFRMTHFMGKTFNITNKRGIVWGFDSSQGRHTANDIRVYVKDYNDLKRAIIP